MAFLGRPSGGDSPFAIGDRALRDHSSPQPPAQRNPTPRKNPGQRASVDGHPAGAGPGGAGSGGGGGGGGGGAAFMATPSPYGSVSDEARRRYEERYAKKKAEEAAKAEAEAREAEEKERQAQAAAQRPQGGQQGYGGPPQGFNGPPQQFFDPPPRQSSGYGQLPPPQQQQQQQSYHNGQRPPSLQPNPGPYSPNLQQPPQRWSNPNLPGGGGLSPQPQQAGFGGSQGHGSRPSSNQGHGYGGSQQGHGGPGYGGSHQGGHNPPPAGRMQWSANAVPPPSQQWNPQPKSPPPPPPPIAEPPRAEDAVLRTLFSQFDSSRSGSLNSYDLERLLAKDETMEAREDCVKMLMNIFDTDRSGSINFQEFEGLYRYIQDWHGIFLRFDRDGSGLIDRKELHQALLGFGFSLPLDMVRKLEKRFAPPPKPGHPPRKGISFDRFLMACVTVKHYTEAFRRTDVSGSGRITLDYNQYMDIILESPS